MDAFFVYLKIKIKNKQTEELNTLISYIKSADYETLDNDLKFIAKRY